MLPRWHILLGAIFTFILYLIFPSIAIYDLILVFLSSFLIDFDHFIVSAAQTKSLSLPRSLDFYRKQTMIDAKMHQKGIRKKGFMQFFHTVEFHLFILILGIFFQPFLFIFFGMLFHSICDFIDMSRRGVLYHRHFFLTSWIINKLK